MDDIFKNITDFLNKFLEFIQTFAESIVKTIKAITDAADEAQS